ncbi:MAG: serine hydrolase [Cyclobacteriaceae bacterium]|nr:serine hydrolase [Cyclobacteriaceae bacterium]
MVIILILRVGSINAQSLDQLSQLIKTELAGTKGTFAVAFRDEAGRDLLINEHERFHAASTMKTPVMIEVFKQAAAGKFKLTDSILIKNEFKSLVDGSPYQLTVQDDSEPVLYTKVGKKGQIYDVMYQMIISSSNLATNIIIEKVDARNVTSTMRSLGAMDLQVLRGVEDSKAFAKGLNNTVTAFDLMLLFDQMSKGKIVDKAASEKMIGILRDQRFNEIIPALLPKEVVVAHKTGWITGVQHDSGIVILPGGKRYSLVLLSKNLTDEKAGIAAMARVSKLIYDFVLSGN